MTSIDFYFNAEDRLQVACRLAGKALKQNQRLLIYAPDPDIAGRIDELLRTLPAATPVPIASEAGVDAEPPPGCELLLNLGADCPPHFERFPRLLEVVSRDENEKQTGRSRYRFYRSRGYPITNHDLARETRQAHE
jgi:DNA polymerase III subunit chi